MISPGNIGAVRSKVSRSPSMNVGYMLSPMYEISFPVMTGRSWLQMDGDNWRIDEGE